MIGMLFPLLEEAATPALTLAKILFFPLGNDLMGTPIGPNYGQGAHLGTEFVSCQHFYALINIFVKCHANAASC